MTQSLGAVVVERKVSNKLTLLSDNGRYSDVIMVGPLNFSSEIYKISEFDRVKGYRRTYISKEKGNIISEERSKINVERIM